MSELSVPLSVLDLALVADGQTTAEALADTVAVARAAEALGYRRIWVAEHHNMDTVASTSPSVLIAHLASVTSTIRVGSGGVMLPNHAPLVVAEQFALLEALHPGRIDLGIGRAPGTDRATAVVLRRGPGNRDDEEFPQNLIDLMGLLGDRRRDRGLWDHFRATPEATSHPDVFLLGSSGFSAQLAGMLGLPFAFAHHFDMGGTIEAAGIYHDHFEPSPALAEPRLIVTASVLIADTDDEAERLSAPNRLRRLGLRTGRLLPLLKPEDALAHPSYPRARDMDTAALVGTADEVCSGLVDLVERTAASEIMVFTSTHGLSDRLRSFELLAKEWGLG
ncbi:MAG: LLM class flavin-dependent oxidoreductase [Acidimicrobiia bacterium]|nr:LLM class flavin-dependent oxidoreductase [Acidimicrobiia bacterium]